MKVGGTQRQVDYGKLGPTLVIASSLVLAIRTARWTRETVATASSPEWEAEVEHSIRIARRVLSQLTAKCPHLFRQREMSWHEAEEDESPK